MIFWFSCKHERSWNTPSTPPARGCVEYLSRERRWPQARCWLSGRSPPPVAAPPAVWNALSLLGAHSHAATLRGYGAPDVIQWVEGGGVQFRRVWIFSKSPDLVKKITWQISPHLPHVLANDTCHLSMKLILIMTHTFIELAPMSLCIPANPLTLNIFGCTNS